MWIKSLELISHFFKNDSTKINFSSRYKRCISIFYMPLLKVLKFIFVKILDIEKTYLYMAFYCFKLYLLLNVLLSTRLIIKWCKPERISNSRGSLKLKVFFFRFVLNSTISSIFALVFFFSFFLANRLSSILSTFLFQSFLLCLTDLAIYILFSILCSKVFISDFIVKYFPLDISYGFHFYA